MTSISSATTSYDKELDEDKVRQLTARLIDMRTRVVSLGLLHDVNRRFNDGSCSDEEDCGSVSEDDVVITYLTEGIKGDALQARIAHKFSQLRQSFAAAVAVQASEQQVAYRATDTRHEFSHTVDQTFKSDSVAINFVDILSLRRSICFVKTLGQNP